MGMFDAFKNSEQKILSGFKDLKKMRDNIYASNIKINKTKLNFYRNSNKVTDEKAFKEVKKGIVKQRKMMEKAKELIVVGADLLNKPAYKTMTKSDLKIHVLHYNLYEKYVNSLKAVIEKISPEVEKLLTVYKKEEELSSDMKIFIQEFPKLFKQEILIYERMQEILKNAAETTIPVVNDIKESIQYQKLTTEDAIFFFLAGPIGGAIFTYLMLALVGVIEGSTVKYTLETSTIASALTPVVGFLALAGAQVYVQRMKNIISNINDVVSA